MLHSMKPHCPLVMVVPVVAPPAAVEHKQPEVPPVLIDVTLTVVAAVVLAQ